MNIDNHIHNAKTYLDQANDKVANQDFDTALAMLVMAYSHTRELLEQVCKLKALKDEVEHPAREDSGGTK